MPATHHGSRIQEIDRHMDSATVSMAGLSEAERKLANELCSYVELPLRSLLRRADAIRRAGGQDSFADCLREAACHLIYRSDDQKGNHDRTTTN